MAMWGDKKGTVRAEIERLLTEAGLLSVPDREFAEYHHNYLKNRSRHTPNLGRMVAGQSVGDSMVRMYRRRLGDLLRRLRGEGVNP